MRRSRLSFTLLVLGWLGSTDLTAQICGGLPSLQTYRANLTVAAELQEEANVVTGAMSLGTQSFFGGIGGGIFAPDDRLGADFSSAPLVFGTFGPGRIGC